MLPWINHTFLSHAQQHYQNDDIIIPHAEYNTLIKQTSPEIWTAIANTFVLNPSSSEFRQLSQSNIRRRDAPEKHVQVTRAENAFIPIRLLETITETDNENEEEVNNVKDGTSIKTSKTMYIYDSIDGGVSRYSGSTICDVCGEENCDVKIVREDDDDVSSEYSSGDDKEGSIVVHRERHVDTCLG